MAILIAFCYLDVSLQTLKPTKQGSTLAASKGAWHPQLLWPPPPSWGPSEAFTHSSVSFSFFSFRHWKSASLAATTLFISFKISSCLILCCSKSSASAWSSLQRDIYPLGSSGLAHINHITLCTSALSGTGVNPPQQSRGHLPQ